MQDLADSPVPWWMCPSRAGGGRCLSRRALHPESVYPTALPTIPETAPGFSFPAMRWLRAAPKRVNKWHARPSPWMWRATGTESLQHFRPSGALKGCLDDIATIRHVTIAGIEIAPESPRRVLPVYHRPLSPALIAITLREGVANDFLFEDLYIHHVFGGIMTSSIYGLDTYPFGNAANDIRIRHHDLRYRGAFPRPMRSCRAEHGERRGTTC